jgi:hypothetical protein
VQPRLDRVTYAEAAAALRTHYEVTGSQDLAEADGRLSHLDASFVPYRLVEITPQAGEAYVATRQASNGTINRELAVLGRMLRLAHDPRSASARTENHQAEGGGAPRWLRGGRAIPGDPPPAP